MGAIIWQQNLDVAALEPYAGSPLPSPAKPTAAPLVMAYALDAPGNVSVRGSLGRIGHELIATARLFIAGTFWSAYTGGPLTMEVQCDAKHSGETAAEATFNIATLGGSTTFPGTGSQIFNYEIEVPIGDARDDVEYLELLEFLLSLKTDAARAGVGSLMYLRALHARLELPDA